MQSLIYSITSSDKNVIKTLDTETQGSFLVNEHVDVPALTLPREDMGTVLSSKNLPNV